MCFCGETIISYPRTDTHLLLSDEDIKVLYYSTPFYEHVPVRINYPFQSGAPPGSWSLTGVDEWLDGRIEGGWGVLVVDDVAGQFIHSHYISP